MELKDANLLLSRCLNLIKVISGTNNNPYLEHYSTLISNKISINDPSRLAKILIYSMMGLREDIIEDSFGSYQELIHADVFANYLERADHLLSEGYEDAAAVILGSSLEVQLRKIAVKYSIDLEYIDSKDEIRRKASSVINSDIKKKEVYNEMYRSQIETWLKLRNHAAHGHYDKYDKGDVSRFLSGLRDFILKFPA